MRILLKQLTCPPSFCIRLYIFNINDGLQEWDEMGIAFDPTYKYVPGSAAVYDSGEASGKVS